MPPKQTKSLGSCLRWAGLSTFAGILSGMAATLFLFLLDWATQTRNAHPLLLWGLPAAGFFIGWAYFTFGKEFAEGSNLILDQIHDPQKKLPLKMAPFILLGTVLTHLFGGSAGREGTAVQMGASLSDQLTHYFTVDKEGRKILLTAGAGAGFGAAIGVPFAGMIFGMEVIQVGKLRWAAWPQCLIASFIAYHTTLLFGAPHSLFPKPILADFSLKTLFWLSVSGILFGLVARFFSQGTHFVEKFHRKFIPYPPLKPCLAGALLVGLYTWEGSYRYLGLGIPTIQEALKQPSTFRDPFFKFIFTALTVGSGFKGGEFIPLVFIGTTLGSALSYFLPLPFETLAVVGFAAVFAAAANTPLACTVMAMEIFGPRAGMYSAIACYSGYYVSGHPGIYRSQKETRAKSHLLGRILKCRNRSK